jgi:hypothetical protein
MLVLVLLPMLIDYFNSCTHRHSLGTAAQIKITGEPSLLFTGLCLITRLCHGRKKEFDDLEDLLVYFKLYFVIVGDNLYTSTMYYLLL